MKIYRAKLAAAQVCDSCFNDGGKYSTPKSAPEFGVGWCVTQCELCLDGGKESIDQRILNRRVRLLLQVFFHCDVPELAVIQGFVLKHHLTRLTDVELQFREQCLSEHTVVMKTQRRVICTSFSELTSVAIRSALFQSTGGHSAVLLAKSAEDIVTNSMWMHPDTWCWPCNVG